MIQPALAQAVLARALATGGDFAEIFAEDTVSNNLTMTDNRMENALSAHRYGAGLRVFKGTQTVYVYTNDLTEAGLTRLADQAAAAMGATRVQAPAFSLIERVNPNINPCLVTPSSASTARKVPIVKAAYAAAKDADPSIAQVNSSLLDVDQKVLIANSEGLYTTDRRIRTRLMVSAIASNGSENQQGYVGPGARRGLELFEQIIDPAAMGREAARIALTMLRAPQCPAGVMPVVIDNGFGGVIFHEACGHSLEATSVGRGNSVFCGKLGQKIASDVVTAVDDGTLPGEWGSLNIDDEGQPTARNVLIEKGVLKSYLIDRLGSRRLNLPMTGSGRRESYQYAPTSRMTNTFIVNGQDSTEEMIATMGDGLFCAKMGGGSVNPVTGEFNFAVLEGYRVKDGKIDHPVRGATLIGKGSEVLFNIDRVGGNLSQAQGMCGSMSGSVPTNVGQPMIRVTQMTVGGR